MMSSAIPARLQFQCGHAALVSLPRVKGETAAQRNQRIAHEKSAALSRQCDFCAPAVVAVSSAFANGNGNASHVVAEVAEVAEVPEVVEVLAQTAAELVAEAEVAEVVETAELVQEIEEAIEALEAIEAIEAIERIEEAVSEDEEVAELVAIPVIAEIVAERPVGPKSRRIARRQTRAPDPAAVARGRRFLVEYQVERVLHAVDIHDALRQASAMGAADVVAITRED